MTTKRYTLGGRPDPNGQYVKRVVMIHHLDIELLDALAERKQRSFAYILRHLIRKYLREQANPASGS